MWPARGLSFASMFFIRSTLALRFLREHESIGIEFPKADSKAMGFNITVGNGHPPRKACGMKICSLGGRSAPKMYVFEGGLDGTGAKALVLMAGLQFAFSNQMNFGGVLHGKASHIIDGHNYSETINHFLGEHAYEELHLPLVSQHDVPSFDSALSVNQILKQRPSFLPTSNILCLERKPGTGIEPNSSLAKAMREPMMQRKLKFAEGNRPTVAIHMRRGDVNLAHVTPNSVFQEVVDVILRKLPNADIHVWSSVMNDRSRENTKSIPKNWTSADFDEFRERGMTIHLDDTDLSEVWTHLVRADILVVDDSSFSTVPALLNPNLVLCAKKGNTCQTVGHATLFRDATIDDKFEPLVRKFS